MGSAGGPPRVRGGSAAISRPPLVRFGRGQSRFDRVSCTWSVFGSQGVAFDFGVSVRGQKLVVKNLVAVKQILVAVKNPVVVKNPVAVKNRVAVKTMTCQKVNI